MAGFFAAYVRNLKEMWGLLWTRPVWIQASKTKSQVGIILIDVRKNYKLESYWLMPIFLPPNFSCAWLAVIFNRNLSELNNCGLRTGNSQAKIIFDNKVSQVKGWKGETTVLQNSEHPKVLQIARYARIANSFVLSVSHLHSHSSWNTDCVCSAGIPVVSILLCHSQSILSAQLIREFLQAACSTSERTTLHTEDYPAKPGPSKSPIHQCRGTETHNAVAWCDEHQGQAGARRGGR